MNFHTKDSGKPTTVQGDLGALPIAFKRYLDRQIWVTWKWTWVEGKDDRPGKWTKPPFRAGGQLYASTTKPNTWCSYAEAVATWQREQADGIGLCLYGLTGDEIVFDLDNCRNPVTGAIAPWARRIVDEANSYAEATPSGTGLRVIGHGQIGRQHRRFTDAGPDGGGVEIYTAGEGRYITVTGLLLPSVWPSIGDIAKVAALLVANKGFLDPQQPDMHAEGARQEQLRQEQRSRYNGINPDHTALWELIEHGVPEGQRSDQFHHACGLAKRLDWTQERLEAAMRDNPAGIGAKYLSPQDRLADEISRSWRKVEEEPMGSTGNAGQQDYRSGRERAKSPFTLPSRAQLVATDEELAAAKISPCCIVKNYLYANLAVVAAAGGTGKTTVTLYEDSCVALGRDLWGLKVENPGWTLFVTAEDERESLIARQRETWAAMELTPEESNTVRKNCLVWDVTGEQIKMIEADDGNLVLTGLADAIVAAFKADPPAIITFDPLVSFGCAESMVNDNEQRLVEAARRIIRGLGCCVRFIHHTGKANARAKTVDQYSARGGSALPDGSRMMMVMVPVSEPDEAEGIKLPSSVTLEPGEQAILLRRAKLSYAPRQPDIYVIRGGYTFRHTGPDPRSEDEHERARMDQIMNFIKHMLAQGVRLSKTPLAETYHKNLGMPVRTIKQLVQKLIDAGRLGEDSLPEGKKGRASTFLNPYPEAPKTQTSSSEGVEGSTSTADASLEGEPPQ